MTVWTHRFRSSMWGARYFRHNDRPSIALYLGRLGIFLDWSGR